MHPNLVQVLLCIAGFCCCIPMSVPQAHLVAFCMDIGISPTTSATMLSVMLASAFIARQAWGALADRIGGLRTIMVGSAEPGARHLGLLAHPGRGRPVRRLRRLRLRLCRHHPGLLDRHPRYLPAVGGLMAHAAHPVHGDERHGGRKLVRWLPLRSSSATTRPPSPPASSSMSSTWRSSASWSCASPADAGSIPTPPSADGSAVSACSTPAAGRRWRSRRGCRAARRIGRARAHAGQHALVELGNAARARDADVSSRPSRAMTTRTTVMPWVALTFAV